MRLLGVFVLWVIKLGSGLGGLGRFCWLWRLVGSGNWWKMETRILEWSVFWESVANIVLVCAFCNVITVSSSNRDTLLWEMG